MLDVLRLHRFSPSTLALVLLGVCAPLSTAGGNLAVGLVLLTAIGVVLKDRARLHDLPGRSIVLMVLVYIGIHALATALASPAPSRWDKWAEEMWMKLLMLAVPVLIGSELSRATKALVALSLAGTVAAAYGFFQHFSGLDLVRDRVTYQVGDRHISVGFFSHHLSFAGSMLLIWIVAAARVLRAPLRGRRIRALAWFAAVMSALALVFNLARSAQLGALAATGLFILDRPSRQRLPLLILVAIAAALALSVPEIRDRFTGLGSENAELTRQNLWRSSVRGIADRPLLGWGVGNFGPMMEEHGVEGFYDSKAHAHNDLLMHAVNAGVLGLLSALILWLWTLVLFWRARVEESAGWIALAAAAAQAAMGVAGLFQVYQTDDEVEFTLYFLVGCGVAISRQVSRSQRRHPACKAPA